MYNKSSLWITSLALGGLLLVSTACAESLQITPPPVLPRGCSLLGYAPLVRVHYADLGSEAYTLKLWLLEDQKYNLASSQWSGRTIPIDNQKGGSPQGQLLLNAAMDVFDYPTFLWVARLYNSAGVEVASAKSKSTSASVRPVLLKPVGRRVATVGQLLRITLATDAGRGGMATFRMQDAPTGASLDSKTGVFTWAPSAGGAVTVVFEVVTGESEVADAELVTIEVSTPDKAADK